jgi:tetratricopeptide (TPR) repeat protein
MYLQLAAWPHPQVLDYGTDEIRRIGDALPFALPVLALLGLALWAIARNPRAGFLGGWFFAILAPSSSVVPIPVQPMAEHRKYLPLAAITALAVLGVHSIWRRGAWLVFAALGVALGLLTIARNAVYAEPGAIWRDTLAKRPANARAHCFYGDLLAAQGKREDALAQYDEALRLERRAGVGHAERTILPDLLVNSANVLRALGRSDKAIERYAEALRIEPRLAAAHFNWGSACLELNRPGEAISQFEAALELDPNNAAAHTRLAAVLLAAGRTADALGHYEAALRLQPSARAHQDLGVALLATRRLTEAVAQLEQAVRLAPDSPIAHEYLGHALAAQGRNADASAQFRRALQLQPDNARARRALEDLSPPTR